MKAVIVYDRDNIHTSISQQLLIYKITRQREIIWL